MGVPDSGASKFSACSSMLPTRPIQHHGRLDNNRSVTQNFGDPWGSGVRLSLPSPGSLRRSPTPRYCSPSVCQEPAGASLVRCIYLRIMVRRIMDARQMTDISTLSPCSMLHPR